MRVRSAERPSGVETRKDSPKRSNLRALPSAGLFFVRRWLRGASAMAMGRVKGRSRAASHQLQVVATSPGAFPAALPRTVGSSGADDRLGKGRAPTKPLSVPLGAIEAGTPMGGWVVHHLGQKWTSPMTHWITAASTIRPRSSGLQWRPASRWCHKKPAPRGRQRMKQETAKR